MVEIDKFLKKMEVLKNDIIALTADNADANLQALEEKLKKSHLWICYHAGHTQYNLLWAI